MRVLEILKEKLRNKNYSENTIKTYVQTVYQFLNEIECKDAYQVTTKEIIKFLEYLIVFINLL